MADETIYGTVYYIDRRPKSTQDDTGRHVCHAGNNTHDMCQKIAQQVPPTTLIRPPSFLGWQWQGWLEGVFRGPQLSCAAAYLLTKGVRATRGLRALMKNQSDIPNNRKTGTGKKQKTTNNPTKK